MHSVNKERIRRDVLFNGAIGPEDTFVAVTQYSDLIIEYLLSEDSEFQEIARCAICDAGVVPAELHHALLHLAENEPLEFVIFILCETRTNIPQITSLACERCTNGTPSANVWEYLATAPNQQVDCRFAEFGISYDASSDSKFIASLFVFKEEPTR